MQLLGAFFHGLWLDGPPRARLLGSLYIGVFRSMASVRDRQRVLGINSAPLQGSKTGRRVQVLQCLGLHMLATTVTSLPRGIRVEPPPTSHLRVFRLSDTIREVLGAIPFRVYPPGRSSKEVHLPSPAVL